MLYLYNADGVLEGIQILEKLAKVIRSGNNAATGLSSRDLPPEIKFNPEKFYVKQYRLERREKDSGHYKFVGYVEADRSGFGLVPFYTSEMLQAGVSPDA